MIKKNDPFKLDAGESTVFQRQLEYVKSKTYDTKYKNLKAVELIPVSTEVPSGSQFITYRRYSKIGLAKIIADYAHDFPRVDAYAEEVKSNVKGIGTSFGYSIPEIRRAQMANSNLETRRANTARRANDEKVNTIAWSGDSDFNLQGLIDYPGITEYTVPNDGTGTTKTWSTKTPDLIIRDFVGITNAVIDTTNGKEMPTQAIMPIIQYRDINTRRVTDGNDMTVLTYLLSNNIIESADWVVELKTAGAGSTARFMVYTKDPDHLTLEIPQAFEQFEAQKKGMEFEIPCHSECGGVIVYYPLSVAFGDGI